MIGQAARVLPQFGDGGRFPVAGAEEGADVVEQGGFEAVVVDQGAVGADVDAEAEGVGTEEALQAEAIEERVAQPARIA